MLHAEQGDRTAEDCLLQVRFTIKPRRRQTTEDSSRPRPETRSRMLSAGSDDTPLLSTFARAKKPAGSPCARLLLDDAQRASPWESCSERRGCWRRSSGPASMGERLSGGGNESQLRYPRTPWRRAQMLVTLILHFRAVSGAHFNPAVTLADASQGGMRWREVPGYIGAQAAGAMLGGVDRRISCSRSRCFRRPQHVRGWRLAALQRVRRHFRAALRYLGLRTVACGRPRRCSRFYITGDYWSTASTSFANPAVTLARAFTNTFAGHPARRCSGLHGCPARWRIRRDFPLSLARADIAATGARCRSASQPETEASRGR